MVGAILIVVALLAIVVGACMAGAVVAAVLGSALTSDADARNEGSELIELNK
ncbi:MAG: hypothetical protein ACRD2C_02125 [Acidimicrobiales bacterium]